MAKDKEREKMISVLIADDHALFREGLRRILEEAGGFRVVGEASDGKDAVEKARASKPDVVLMDVSMPRLNGIEATRQIVRVLPATKVLVVSTYDNEDHVFRSLQAGAAGYLLKDSTTADLIRGIKAVAADDPFFSPGISRLLIDGYLAKKGAPVKRSRFDMLTNREREVLQLIAEGSRNKEIAAHLGLSVKTVEVHRARAMEKLGIHNVAGLVKLAIQKGLVKVG